MTALTPIGQRTLTEFKKRYGDKDGLKRFTVAMSSGILDRRTMENVFIADNQDGEQEGSAEELAAVDKAVNNRGIQGLDSVTSRVVEPNPTKPGTRRVPTGLPNLGRSARGKYQSRPG
jgi:hypothetical protein